jgi:hypothetical protein
MAEATDVRDEEQAGRDIRWIDRIPAPVWIRVL